MSDSLAGLLVNLLKKIGQRTYSRKIGNGAAHPLHRSKNAAGGRQSLEGVYDGYRRCDEGQSGCAQTKLLDRSS